MIRNKYIVVMAAGAQQGRTFPNLEKISPEEVKQLTAYVTSMKEQLAGSYAAVYPVEVTEIKMEELAALPDKKDNWYQSAYEALRPLRYHMSNLVENQFNIGGPLTRGVPLRYLKEAKEALDKVEAHFTKKKDG